MTQARALLRLAKRALIALLGVALLYLLAAWIGSTIPRNASWREPAEGVTIMVETNGIHTGIVMPIVTPQKDWRTTFPSATQPLPGGALPTHIAVGWGEREIYLNTPTWSDLDPLTALRIVTLGGDSVLRVGHYLRPAPAENYRPLRITPAQYVRLAKAIEASLPPLAPGEARKSYRGFGADARYFSARGRYTPLKTCNVWVSDRLAEAGITTGWWAPLAGGVMKWVPRPSHQHRPQS